MEKKEVVYATTLPLSTYLAEKNHLTQLIEEPKKTFQVTGTLVDSGTAANRSYLRINENNKSQTFTIPPSEHIKEKYGSMYNFISHLKDFKDKEIKIKFNTKNNTLVDLM